MTSIISPVWNEDARNLRTLTARLTHVLEAQGASWELLFVDDGSSGRTVRTLQAIAQDRPQVRVLRLRRHYGQETAVVAGLLASRGEGICTIDCDLENQPEDVPRVLAPLRAGYDLVLGTRRAPEGRGSVRGILSRAYTALMNGRWDMHLSDWGCGLNACHRELVEPLRTWRRRWVWGPLKAAGVHRARRWTEVEVSHQPRRFGHSGYSAFWSLYCGISMMVRGTSLTLQTLSLDRFIGASEAREGTRAWGPQRPPMVERRRGTATEERPRVAACGAQT